MSKFTVFYDGDLTDSEKSLLARREAVVMDALKGRSLYWSFVEDDKERRYYRLFSHGKSECFLQLVEWELERLSDDEVKAAIVGNERPCKEPPTTRDGSQTPHPPSH